MTKENLKLLDIKLRKEKRKPNKRLKKDMNLHPYGKMYENTRIQFPAVKSQGIKFTKEIIEVNGEQKIKWHVSNNNFHHFNSRFTFFPLYDTDGNSFIRLHRLHRAYKEKKLKVPFQKKETIPDINTFKKCLILMNEQLTKEFMSNPDPLVIGKDLIEPYVTAGEKLITTQRLPLRMLWTVNNPYSKNTPEYWMFPSSQKLFGRFTFKNIKANSKQLKEDEQFLLRYPAYKKTRGYNRKYFKSRKKDSFKEIEEKDLSFNMFNDF